MSSDVDVDKYKDDSVAIKYSSGEVNLPITLFNTDRVVVPGEYEGGCSLWESSLILCRSLLNAVSGKSALDNYETSIESSNLNGAIKSKLQAKLATGEPLYVVELGCGQGLPSCTIATVAKEIGIPPENIYISIQDLNICAAELAQRNLIRIGVPKSNIGLYVGSWKQMASDFDSVDFGFKKIADLLLMSEVIYRTHHYYDLCRIIEKMVRVESDPECSSKNTIIVLATKRMYFGVENGNGGSHSFTEFIKHFSDGTDIPLQQTPIIQDDANGSSLENLLFGDSDSNNEEETFVPETKSNPQDNVQVYQILEDPGTYNWTISLEESFTGKCANIIDIFSIILEPKVEIEM